MYYSSINFKQRILDEPPITNPWQTFILTSDEYNKSIKKIDNQWATTNTSLNYNGIKPPTPHIIPITETNKNYNHPIPDVSTINIPNNILGTSKVVYPTYQINSRDPYRVQYMINGYGGHQSGLGTNIGS